MTAFSSLEDPRPSESAVAAPLSGGVQLNIVPSISRQAHPMIALKTKSVNASSALTTGMRNKQAISISKAFNLLMYPFISIVWLNFSLKVIFNYLLLDSPVF